MRPRRQILVVVMGACIVSVGLCSSAIAVPITVSFQQGVNGYGGTVDTSLNYGSNIPAGELDRVLIDGSAEGSEPDDGLLQFHDIFGNADGQIHLPAKILAVHLIIEVGGESNDGATLHRVLQSWDETSTWVNSFGGNGVDTDNIEASSSVDCTVSGPPLGTLNLSDSGLVTTVQAWADGMPNHGWVFLTPSWDGWNFYSSEYLTVTNRPLLEVTYDVPEPHTISMVVVGALALLRKRLGS